MDNNTLAYFFMGCCAAAFLAYLLISRFERKSMHRLEELTNELHQRIITPAEMHKKHGAEWDRVKALEDDAEFLRARDEMVRREPKLSHCAWFNHEEQVRERTLLRLSQLARK